MNRHRSKFGAQLGVGLLAIAIGMIFLLDNFGLVNANYVLRFWPVIFIVIGTVRIFQSRGVPGYFVGGVLIAIGAFMIAHRLGLVYFRWRDWWPAFLIVVGTAVILKAWYRRNPALCNVAPAEHTDTINASAIFGGYRQKSDSQNFRGGDISAVMGGFEIDLRQASIQGDAVLNIFAFWGGVEIKVPPDWQVVVQITPILGGVDDQTMPATGSGKKLIITGTLFMGGIEVKN